MNKLIQNAILIIESLSDETIYQKNKTKLEHLITNFGTYSMPYLFTNENINGYYGQMDFKEKSVLTVVGSGDHVLNAVLRGATRVDAFDISSYAIMAYYLKEAAIKTLEYEEYTTYFLDSNECFNYELYEKIRPSLNEEALIFWDSIYEKFKMNPQLIMHLFRGPEDSMLRYFDTEEKAKRLANISAYLDRENYYQLRQNLGNCQINCHIRDVNALDDLNDNYDCILLSNISKYQLDLDFEKFKSAISRYISKLNMLGEIKFGYYWGACDPEYLARCEVIRDGLGIEGIEITKIPSQYFEIATPGVNQMHDAVVGYRRSK